MKMNDAKIINQINLNSLLEVFSQKQIENALVNIYLKDRDISIKKNKLILNIINTQDEKVVETVRNHLMSKKVLVDLMTIEKIFELMLAESEKKNSGTYYTPYFIVEFMTNALIKKTSNIIDPACGCGAFLIGAANRLHELSKTKFIDIIENNIFGVDISASSIQRAKIMLTLLALANNEDADEINFNLSNSDSLLMDWRKNYPEIFHNGGFDIVIGNPPYTNIGITSKHEQLKKTFKTLSGNSPNVVNTYLLFIELALSILRNDNGCVSMIVPLSIAFNSGKSFMNVRKIIQSNYGQWQFSFYDRSPDSLFGDNIKTRNCIFFYNRQSEAKFDIATTNLCRWNSKNRSTLFNKINYQALKNRQIENGIPKISDSIEELVLAQLEKPGLHLGDFINKSGIRNDENNYTDESSIYIYSTAYNWLSIFREVPKSLHCNGKKIIPASVVIINCGSNDVADFVYAILNSRLVYWYWMVYGDGFHLTQNFIKCIPIDIKKFDITEKNQLIALAKTLDAEKIKYPIYKVNNGKSIENYNVLECMHTIDQIDAILIHSLSLPSYFGRYLKDKYISHISAGRSEFKNSEILGYNNFNRREEHECLCIR